MPKRKRLSEYSHRQQKHHHRAIRQKSTVKGNPMTAYKQSVKK